MRPCARINLVRHSSCAHWSLLVTSEVQDVQQHTTATFHNTDKHNAGCTLQCSSHAKLGQSSQGHEGTGETADHDLTGLSPSY